MPIPLPSYDDRRWTDLVVEAQAMIPGLDATWTDFNAHDPGITLIELVSWLVEGDLYRLNRVPDRHLRKFLELVGRPLRPPVAARVAAGLNPPAAGLAGLPAGVEFTATALNGSTCRFRSRDPLDPVLPPLAAALVQADADSPPVDHTADLTRAGRLVALGSHPGPGAALWLGFGTSGFDLQLMSWGDGTGVPTSGNNLVIVGTDNNNLLHIRIFDQDGNRVTDIDETKLPPAQAQAILTLKQQLPGLLPPHVMTDAEKAQVLREATSIAGQTRTSPSKPLPAGSELRLHFRFRSGRSGPDERRRIVAELDAQRRACRPSVISSGCGPEGKPSGGPSSVSTQAPPLAHHDARIAWDYYGTAGWTTLDPAAGQVRDETRALTLDGPVTIVLPGPTQGKTAAGRSSPYWLRVRLASGAFDAPPSIGRVLVNALDLEQAVGSVGRHVIAPGASVAGAPAAVPGPARISLRYNADDAIVLLAFDQDPAAPECEVLAYRPATATARGLLVLDMALLGRSDEAPDREFALPGAPVQGGSVQVYTLEPPATAAGAWAWRACELHADLDAADRGDRWATVDEVAGLVRFGNGNRGLIPPSTSPVLARCRVTAGSAGNVKAGTLSGLAPSLRNWLLLDAQVTSPGQRFAAADLDAVLGADPATAWRDLAPSGYSALTGPLAPPALTQPDAASGGADAEDVLTAAGEAVLALGEPTRAITEEDYRTLSLQTPGTILARVDVASGQCPSLPGLRAPGVVTVIIVPDSPPRPSPSPGLLEAVRCYLDRRRIIGTFAAVVGPSYLIVSVIAQVQSAAGARASRVLADVTAAINAFLDPLGGGPAAIAAMSPAPAPAPGQTTVAATNAFGAVQAVGPSAATPIPGVQLLAATQLSVPQATPTPTPPPGWPFGRSVYRAEVLQVIRSVAGVDHVESLELSGDGAAPTCGNLCVGPLQLVAPGTHSITIL